MLIMIGSTIYAISGNFLEDRSKRGVFTTSQKPIKHNGNYGYYIGTCILYLILSIYDITEINIVRYTTTNPTEFSIFGRNKK